MFGHPVFQKQLSVEDRFVPSSIDQVHQMLSSVAKIGEKHIDLGCGDGQVIKEGLILGLNSFGCELDPVLFSEVSKKFVDRVFYADWNLFDISSYTLISIYCSKESGDKIIAKAHRDCKVGTRVITFWGIPSYTVV